GDTGEILNEEFLDSPTVIIDNRKPLNPQRLGKILEKLGKERKKRKEKLKVSEPLKKWFTSFMKNLESYRLNERASETKDFCVVQRFLDGIETYSAKGRLLLSRGLIKGELEPSPRLVDSLFKCSTCGQCYDQLCEDTLEIDGAIVRARHEVAKRGLMPAFGKTSLRNILEEGNPMGMPAEDRTIWWEDLSEKHTFHENEILYWPGCTTAYRLPSVVEATSKVLEQAGVDFGFLGEKEECCGLVLYLAGLWKEAEEIARLRAEELGGSIRTLVTSCAGCFFAFSKIYPKLGISLPFKVLHTSQLFDTIIEGGRIRFRSFDERLAWHDPCDLGRHSGVYREPRSVIRAIPGVELKEGHLSKEHSLCCGGGGGLMAYDLGLAEKVATSKIREDLALQGVKWVATGCPACLLTLRAASKSESVDMQILDLSELLVKAL
ncbi:MAG: (Fe-S)-binding protein, partial [Candidatus Bathyarchaeota archaeon]